MGSCETRSSYGISRLVRDALMLKLAGQRLRRKPLAWSSEDLNLNNPWHLFQMGSRSLRFQRLSPWRPAWRDVAWREQVIRDLLGSGIVPVIAPIGVDASGQTYNCNADTAAGAIAGALKAHRLLLLTDVAGVLNKEKELLRQLDADEVRWPCIAFDLPARPVRSSPDCHRHRSATRVPAAGRVWV